MSGSCSVHKNHNTDCEICVDGLKFAINNLPTSAAAKKKIVRWVIDHRIFTRPVLVNKTYGPMDEFIFDSNDNKESKYIYLNSFNSLVDIDLVYINPKTNEVDDNDILNVKPVIWIEAGPYYDLSKDPDCIPPEGGWTPLNRYIAQHDMNLDCGGDTLEEALLQLAVRVEYLYGDTYEHGTD